MAVNIAQTHNTTEQHTSGWPLGSNVTNDECGAKIDFTYIYLNDRGHTVMNSDDDHDHMGVLIVVSFGLPIEHQHIFKYVYVFLFIQMNTCIPQYMKHITHCYCYCPVYERHLVSMNLHTKYLYILF